MLAMLLMQESPRKLTRCKHRLRKQAQPNQLNPLPHHLLGAVLCQTLAYAIH